jgi:uncharacterized protein (DUF58 family)
VTAHVGRGAAVPEAARESGAAAPGLAPGLRARARQIQLRTRRQVSNLLAGAYKSTFRGTGIEFDEVRPYQIGDDVRSIDWNVTARTGDPHVKTFVEERQLALVLMVDGSPSMDFGTARSKRDAAAELAALLATVAQAQHDLVGLTLFGGARELHLPPRKGEAAILRVVREVLAPAGGSDSPVPRPRSASESALAVALGHQERLSRRRALLFVLGDWLPEGAAPSAGAPAPARQDWEAPLARLARRHDVVAVRVFDAFEEALPAAGLVVLEDAERGGAAVVDCSSRAVREAWAARAAARRAELARALSRAGVELLELSTSSDPADALARFFRRRASGRAAAGQPVESEARSAGGAA